MSGYATQFRHQETQLNQAESGLNAMLSLLRDAIATTKIRLDSIFSRTVRRGKEGGAFLEREREF